MLYNGFSSFLYQGWNCNSILLLSILYLDYVFSYLCSQFEIMSYVGSLPLPWSIRMKIALGAAKGLAFLHEEADRPVIYRDFKTSNILLDAVSANKYIMITYVSLFVHLTFRTNSGVQRQALRLWSCQRWPRR